MKLSDYKISFLIICISSLIFTFNLFVHAGEPATFDGSTHITTLYQVAEGLKSGEFPVTWLQKFAHYGSPIPLYAHQTTMYFGAVISLFLKDPVLSSKILAFIFSVIGGWGMYLLLRRHTDPLPALVGSILFMFAPYRILNTYVRGALPEFAAQSLAPYLLLSIHMFINSREFRSLVFITIITALLVLTHTFMIVITAPFAILYTLAARPTMRQAIILGIAGILGIALAGYYIVPLITEINYFYYGLEPNHYKEGQFLQLKNFLSSTWPYITETDRFTRPHVLLGGLLEGIIVLFSTAYYTLIKRPHNLSLPFVSLLASLIYIILMLPISEPLYQASSFLGNIQHPWRMMAGYSLAVSILAAHILHEVRARKAQALISIALCSLVMFLAAPQLYAKNYTLYPISHYAFTKENLHGNPMVTLWAGEPEDYPRVKDSIRTIEGSAKIQQLLYENTRREYHIRVDSDARFVSYTFYFPGWHVKSNGREVPIEFQDINYRGLTTFKLPKGDHRVLIEFVPTKKRMLGFAFSASALVMILLSSVVYKKYEKIIN